MEPVSLFDLAAQQARWLSVRQSAVAGNIANANTPDYQAVDVEPFERVLDNGKLAVAPTHPGHIPIGTAPGAVNVREDADAVVNESGNSVSLEQEMVKAGEVRRTFEMNTAIVKAFHRMMMMTTRT
ncbi:flagellar basal body rod protein FlgB [Mesorhizobium xinjiangense]|uniref:flagellar basal body rod protein FlgB n=1 Tax=Mesorhizobium xinjiangense TaxID=2678685 RepID=UPI0012ED19B1|nr:flagellar basal body rod protein FlgB [Mesorhizobium xinjiangense]